MKQLKESMISDENVNKDIQESARKVESSKGAVAVVQQMKKIIKSDKCSILRFLKSHDRSQQLQMFDQNFADLKLSVLLEEGMANLFK